MPRLLARRPTTWEVRPVIIASSTPVASSIFMPWPSWEWNALYSWPSSPMKRVPSVSTPSTSKAMSLMGLARSKKSCMLVCLCCARRLYHACPQQVVHVECADDAAVLVDHQHAVDLVLLHLLHRFGGQLVGADGVRVGGHDIGHPRGADIGGLVQGASQVAVGEDACQPLLRIHHCG